MAKKPKKGAKARVTKSPREAKATTRSRRRRIEVVNGVRLEVSAILEAAVEKARTGLLQPQPAEMTTTQAAEFLDVSRPFVIKLVRQGKLPCRMVGKHRRIPTPALQSFKESMFHEARSAADEVTRMSQALGLYDLEGPAPKTR